MLPLEGRVGAGEGIVRSAKTESPLDTKNRRKKNIEGEEELEAEGCLNEDAEDSKRPTSDFVEISLLDVDVDDTTEVEEGNEGTAEDETASDSAVKERIVELESPGDGNTDATADVLGEKLDPAVVLLREGHVKQRVKDDTDRTLHEITKGRTEGDSLGELVLDDHDSSDETTVETAESLVDLVRINRAHDQSTLAKEQLTVGHLIDITHTIAILINSVILLIGHMELLEGIVELEKTGTDLLESTSLLEGLDDGDEGSKVGTAEGDNQTVDHDDGVLGHLVVDSLALAEARDQVGPSDNKAVVDGVSDGGERVHCVLDALWHAVGSAPQEAADAGLLNALLGLLRCSLGSSFGFLVLLGLGLPLSQYLFFFTAHLVGIDTSQTTL